MTELECERNITIDNMSNDIFKIESILESIEGLTPEGEIIREDLIGLLHFGSDNIHQVDALMIERRKTGIYTAENKGKLVIH